MAKDQPSHGHFLMLLRVTGANQSAIDNAAREIDAAFMAEFGDLAAFTAGLFELLHMIHDGTNVSTPVEWNYVLRFYGPVQSVAWLQQRLEDVAESMGATIATQTFTARDITGRY